MTQLFDPETGVVTPVTVIEAEPCPVVAGQDGRRGRLRRGPARLRAGRRAEADEARARAPEEERRRGAYRHAARAPRPERARRRRERHRRGLRAGREGQGQRDLARQGLRRDDQAAQLPSRPEDARLAQRPQAGLDRRLRDAVARVQGHEDGRPDGRQARDAGRPRASTTSTRSGTSCSSRAQSRARRTASSRSGRRRE